MRVILGCVVLAALAWLAIFITGSVLVHDPTGNVVTAVVTNHPWERGLRRVPGGIFIAFPKMTGEIEVRCRDGSTMRGGYVTQRIHAWVRTSGQGCDRPLVRIG